MEMEHEERETNLPQLSGIFGLIISESSSRFRGIDDETLKQAAIIIRAELSNLEDALQTLTHIERGIMKDIYINGVSWISITHKWHVSESTISRYRKKSLDKIWRYMTRGLSIACEGVIECTKQRKARMSQQTERT